MQLVAPTSARRADRARLRASRGFIYLVSVTGTTGARDQLDATASPACSRACGAHTDLPLLGGFGISAPEHGWPRSRAGADGVIVGSAAIEAAEAGGPAALARVRRRGDRRGGRTKRGLTPLGAWVGSRSIAGR